MQPDTGGPYLAVAAFCDVVIEATDKTISCIRFIDQINLSGPSEEMPVLPIPIRGLISFKTGSFRGTKQLTLQPNKPSGEPMKPGKQTMPVQFAAKEGEGETAVNVL